jgi:anti-sigma factor RsiW
MSDITRTDTSPIEPDDDDRSVLSAYLDDELDADERAQVDARVAGSPEWRAELDDVRAARDAVRGLAMRDLPAGFMDRVTAAVASSADIDDVATIPAAMDPAGAAQITPPIQLGPRRERTRRRAVGWMVGAAAAVVIALAMFVLPGRGQVHPNVTAVATQHAASNADVGDPISGLVGLAPMRGGR